MNLERFHAIILAVSQDVTSFDYPGRLADLAREFENRVNAPQEPSYIQNADKIITELREKLPQLASNTFPPSWKELLREYGIQTMLGDELLKEIEGILEQKDITPTIVRDQLKKLSEELTSDIKHFKTISEAFQWFKFGTDEPAPGTAEMGVTIPRAAVHNGLSELGKELTSVSKIVKVFQEIATGSREEPQINSIGSSDFGIFFALDPATALKIAEAISKLIEAYKVIIKIKEQINDLRQTVPPETLVPLTQHANSVMETKISAMTEEIISEKNGIKKEIRKKEIKIELKGALESIAVRIDKGFEFEVRAKQTENAADGEAAAPERVATTEALKKITELQKALSYVHSEGEPILNLPGKLADDPKDEAEA